MHSLRINGETDDEFRERAERAARFARVLVDACLNNGCVREYIADETLSFYTAAGMRQAPIVRIEYEEAIAIGGLGETLRATRSKHWGDGPRVLPLEPDDWFFAERITYVYRESSVYHRRFEQRRRLKELLGRRHRPLVERAKYRRHTKTMFLGSLTKNEERAIRRIVGVEPGEFWRACRGARFLALPPREVQLELPFE